MTAIITIPAAELESLAERHGKVIEFAADYGVVSFGAALEYRAPITPRSRILGNLPAPSDDTQPVAFEAAS